MQIPQLQINQVPARIGIRTIPPVQEIQQKPADLSIKQTKATMTIDRKPSRLEIDQEQAWNELNVKRLSVLSKDMTEYSRQVGLEAIAQIAQEGDQLAAIEKNNNAIVDIAIEKGLPLPADFNIAFIPSHGSVKINYIPTELHIHWKLGGAEINAVQNKPIHHYTPGKVEIYLRQKQNLDIHFTGTNINDMR
ncbi:DUF6470 family protein [Neobacillus thermocopriae]|uniref:DUF6470 family protein n=1 Tax=Neobacillus thermocopriae TaxID=1215031 RepID=UPI002E208452|nr:DUF6470 family protein [Neobacillus thermocopriae]MED3713795.1 DUF6470 family protein [Neobacillus thermocopriae]